MSMIYVYTCMYKILEELIDILYFLERKNNLPVVMVHAYNPRTWKVEAGEPFSVTKELEVSLD